MYRIAHTGDSISAMAYGFAAPGGVVNDGEVWRNLEYGRNCVEPGMGLPNASGSTWDFARAATGRVRPGGFVVVQDNGFGCTDEQWEMMLRAVEYAACPDIWLVGVLPGFIASVDAALSAQAAARATVMGQVFMTHPLRRFVYLNTYMAANPSYFPDGQHPTAYTAQAWIRSAITSATT